MLKERTKVRQRPGESSRRWFTDEYFDLIVWSDDQGEIILFQLGYDPDGVDGLWEWRRASGLSHFRVDTGGLRPARHARTPFLVPADPPARKSLVKEFAAASTELDSEIRDFVLGKLQ